MRFHRKEVERLRKAESAVGSKCSRFGVNKRREITRLLYEISKREAVPPGRILGDAGGVDFGSVKDRLVRRRFPRAWRSGELSEPYLPSFRLDPGSRAAPESSPFYPKRIIVESAARESGLPGRFAAAFPDAELSETGSLRNHIAPRGRFTAADYNARRETVFIVDERSDFFKKCPCTAGAVPCGYHVFNLSFGCIFDCSYCYLQDYVNSPGIVFPARLGSFFDRFQTYMKSRPARSWQRGSRLRIGTGEFSDSLMLDGITGYSPALIDFFRGRGDVIFEFKTKSANVDNLLEARGGDNIVVAWSLNPQRMIDENEAGAAPLRERLRAASRCAGSGYRIAFHFDPVFHFDGWEDEYGRVIDALFEAVAPEEIAWVSVGTLRFAPPVKQMIEARFPNNTILDAELLPGFDGKLRYPVSVRRRIYRLMIDMLKKHRRDLPLYLCMEERPVWRDLGLEFPFK